MAGLKFRNAPKDKQCKIRATNLCLIVSLRQNNFGKLKPNMGTHAQLS